MSNITPPRKPVTHTPVYALASLVVFVAALTLLYLLDKADGAGLLVAVAVGNIPTLVAAIASETAARDIRNGTVAEKARQGAVAAIEESGVMLRNGPVANAQLAALNATLTELHTLTSRTESKVDRVVEGQQTAADLLVDGGPDGLNP